MKHNFLSSVAMVKLVKLMSNCPSYLVVTFAMTVWLVCILIFLVLCHRVNVILLQFTWMKPVDVLKYCLRILQWLTRTFVMCNDLIWDTRLTIAIFICLVSIASAWLFCLFCFIQCFVFHFTACILILHYTNKSLLVISAVWHPLLSEFGVSRLGLIEGLRFSKRL